MARSGSVGEEVDEALHRNEVLLIGRVSGEPEVRQMPSGDEMVSLRLVVRRPAPKVGRASGSRQVIDTIDCGGWLAGPKRAMLGLRSGDTVQIVGSVHRRFYRVGPGPASRYEIEVAKVKRLARAQLSA